MTGVASRETRAAREDLRAAEAAEKAHRKDCIDCIRAVGRRKPAGRCGAGRDLSAAVRDADRRWRDERDLDLQPGPGQEALW